MFEICPGHALVVREGSRRVWFQQVNITCSDCWSWFSLPDEHTQCFQALSLWLDSRWGCLLDVIAGEWQPRPEHLSHLLKAGRMVLFFCNYSVTCERKVFHFSLLNTGSQGCSQSVRGQTTELLLIFHCFLLLEKQLCPFSQTARKRWIWLPLPNTSAQTQGWGCKATVLSPCKQQGEVSGTLICPVHSHWPHISHWAREVSVSWKHLAGLSGDRFLALEY